MKTIYCDESGYTGDNLVDNDQPYFVYCGVDIDNHLAGNILDKLSKDFNLNLQELKGKKLLKYSNGRKALKTLFQNNISYAKFIINHKKYALSAKIFDYCIEPVIADHNSFYYQLGFHRFISNGIYYLFNESYDGADELFIKLYKMISNNDLSILDDISKSIPDDNSFFSTFTRFCICHKDIILDEISSTAKYSKWILDLSLASLHSLLCYYGESGDGLKVFCDDSKPLKEKSDILSVMLNRNDIIKIKFEDKEHIITYNLLEPVQFVSSASSIAIQLADLFSSTLNYSLKNHKTDKFSKEILSLSKKSIIYDRSVFPDPSILNLKKYETLLNSIILHEITDYSVKGLDIHEELKNQLPRIERLAKQKYFTK